jgi:signal transduction histidine kinase
MRFDDMIATVLAQGGDAPARLAARWRQLVDLLAQSRGGGAAAEDEAAARAYAWLRAHRDRIDPALRRRVAESLAGLAVDPEMLVFFAEDRAAIAAPLIVSARLRGAQWRGIMPRLGPAGRALLRHRRDLDERTRRALAAFGATDFVIAGAVATAERAPGDGESQIRELVERIEAYRRQKGEPAPAPDRADDDARSEPVESFRWEAGTDGVIRWVSGAARGAILGQGIATIAAPGRHGVDGQAAGAFEKRAPFRDARLTVAGAGPASGDWRISGVPRFDPARGAFLGYRGAARRPRLDEVARPPAPAGPFGSAMPADSVRQLVHELRTPLNAITGFAELIEGQYMGPAAAPYRQRAGRIMGDARQLLAAIDDLDTAARIETKRLDLDPRAIDAAAMVARLHQSYARVAADRGGALTLDLAEAVPPARADEAAAERMFGRLFAATIGLAGAGETLAISLAAAPRGAGRSLRLAIDRPAAIAGLDEAGLLDPGYSPDGDWPDAPALGLGFALRLVRNLAEAAGGALEIGPERIALVLPAAAADEDAADAG